MHFLYVEMQVQNKSGQNTAPRLLDLGTRR
jgi:hypothetical protein